MPVFEVVRGSLLDQDVEVIVNAANTSMRGGSGIDGAVHRAAGPDLVLELMRWAPHGAKTAEIVVTGGHRARFKHIFHVAGPVWNGGNQGEEELLLKCYVYAAMKAVELGVRSIGFCSISTGIFRFPLDKASIIAVSGVKSVLENSDLERVVFAMYREEEYEAFLDAHRVAFPTQG